METFFWRRFLPVCMTLGGILSSLSCTADPTACSGALKSGCVLGYDLTGVKLACLKDGTVTRVLRGDDAHRWRHPVWNERLQRFYCVNARSKPMQVVSIALGDRSGEVVFTAPEGWRISEMATVEDDLLIMVYETGASPPPSQLVALDPLRGTERVVASGTYGPLIQPVDNGAVFLTKRRVVGSKFVRLGEKLYERPDLRNAIERVCLDTSEAQEVLPLPDDVINGLFRLSPDGDTAFIVRSNPDNPFSIVRLDSSTIEDFHPKGLPGRGGFPVCFAGDDRVLMQCWEYSKWFLGTYEINLATGETRRLLFTTHFTEMKYLPTCPLEGGQQDREE